MGRGLENALPLVPNRSRQHWVRLMINPTLMVGVVLLGIILVRSHISRLHVWPWAVLVLFSVLAEGLTSPHTLSNYMLYRAFRNWDRHRLSEKTEKSSLELRGVPEIVERLLVGPRRQRRWLLFAGVVALFWAQAWFVARVYPANEVNLLFIFVLLFGSAIIPYSMMVPELYERFQVARSAFFWLGAPVLGLSGALLYGQGTGAWCIVLSTALLLYLLHFYAYAVQRFLMGEKAHSQIVLAVSKELLNSQDPRSSLRDKVPQIMERMLRYQRVFIVEPTSPARTHLQVTGQAGDYKDVRFQQFPVKQGITGRAFRSGEQIFFNDTCRCRFYHDATGEDGRDDTHAEIATPIMHQGEIFGVLDVEDNRLGVYGEEDLASLEVIAELLGAVLAAAASDRLMREARIAWSKMGRVRAGTERSVFWEVSAFALESLGAQTAVYWPFTPGGYPAAAALVRTTGREVLDELCCPDVDCIADDPLISLAASWRPVYETESLLPAISGSLVLLPTVPGHKSALLLPVGSSEERFGLLLLLFRDKRQLTSLVRSVAVSLAQGFANLVAGVRYRAIFFDGIARPELDLHVLMNRYGTKWTAVQGARDALRQQPLVSIKAYETHPLHKLMQNYDRFVDVIAQSQATLPPDFWQSSLRLEVQKLQGALPRLESGRQPLLVIEEFDRRVEGESGWTKLAIYRVIVEAAQNAAVHGNAQRVTVALRRQDRAYALEVRNDGKPIPLDAGERSSRNGIYKQLARLREQFRATTDFYGCEERGEVVVRVCIPGLPTPTVEED